MQLSYLFKEEGDFALSKDVDVAMWQDYRAFSGLDPVTDAVDFVVINSRLHVELDEFKKEIPQNMSYLKINKLLQLYVQPHHTIVTKYGHTYLLLSSDQIDELCRWLYQMRAEFEVKQHTVFGE